MTQDSAAANLLRMEWTFEDAAKAFSGGSRALLLKSRHGIERECLRVTADGELATSFHPKVLGAKLTHPYITTDFSEVQLELVTPAYHDEKRALGFLKRLHRYVYGSLAGECLWPASTPCRLPDGTLIPLADYGQSQSGLYKTLYRQGLAHRYGAKMQMLSGIHYNFSLARELWGKLQEQIAAPGSLQDFISEAYFHLIRNFLRYSWLSSYLFGATPAVDRSYFDSPPEGLDPLGSDSLYAPYACSLRMSEYGYYSKVQAQLAISTNDFASYLSDMRKALETRWPAWEKIPSREQINPHLLQIEAEHYQRMRPKAKPGSLRPIEGLRSGGVHYVEARGVDINPLVADGLEEDQLYFLHTFCVYCLMRDSALMSEEENRRVVENQNQVALRGRDPALKLWTPEGELLLTEYAAQLLDAMRPVAKLLDAAGRDGRYTASLERQCVKLAHPELLPSQQVLEAIEAHGGSHQSLGVELSKEHRRAIVKRKPSRSFSERMDKLASDSFKQQLDIEREEDFVLKGYEQLELSTQMVVREALSRGCEVEVLDAEENLIRLRRAGQVEYIKQASMTRRDSLISYYLMENKEVSKRILHEIGLSVPQGVRAMSPESALEQALELQDRELIVKPNRTNYGIGITQVPPGDKGALKAAIQEAFRHGDDVIVEDYIAGPEYRFLVMDGKLEAVCHRVPANVTGDGVHTVRQLVQIKNRDPSMYKAHKYRIRTGKIEQEVLDQQGYSLDTVLAAGTTAYLRKVSNCSVGGDPHDYTDSVHPDWAPLVIQATEAVGACFCGLDIITTAVDKPPGTAPYAIIEVNFNPALFLHRYPVRGKMRYVEGAVLDALGINAQVKVK